MSNRTQKYNFYNKAINSPKKLKKALSAKELVFNLENHGLKILNHLLLEEFIKENGYYFYTGYRRIFISSYENNLWDGHYINNINEQDIMNLIEIDKKLGSVLLEYANIVERRIKSRTSYFLSVNTSEEIHLNSLFFKSIDFWTKNVKNKYESILKNGIKDQNPIILHHVMHYDCKLPIWVFFEHISFGDFIYIMKNFDLEIQNSTFDDIFTSENLKFPIKKYMSNAAALDILFIINMVRNRIAHIGRLYDWKFHYDLGGKSFTENYYSIFNPNKDEFLFSDIVDIFGFYLLEKDHDNLKYKIFEIIEEALAKIPAPFNTRMLEVMGYHSIDN